MARPSRNIRVLDGGRIACAVADIEFPLMATPRTGASTIHLKQVNLVRSYRNAAIT
jgi:hypothetical protein